MGIDGISLWLIVLTTFLTPLCVLISWKSIHDRVKEFFILLLVLETALIGVFTCLDLFLFYFFWEATLIPMALLIGVFGHERKVYAAVKFFMYTMIASVFMLAAILWLYAHTAASTLSRFASTSRRSGSELSCRGPMALPRILHCVRGQSSAVPISYVAARCARRSADRRIRTAGRRPAEDGNIWHVAVQSRTVPGASAPQCTVGR